ncbi:hypothetical protein GCM10009535_24210 [Streptomyces thermocarboxydovorans]|uniref:Dioxygenase n=1 Tax=Streptomyces thermocarboxydovorans TaxID=59298 RepID=A0ABP3SKL3_9ACTN
MQTELSQTLGIEHAVFGFTPFPAVAAAISRAGGLGVLGAVRYTAPDELARDLDWIEAHTGGQPYGLDVVMPAKKVEGVTEADVEAMIPEGHRAWVKDLLARFGVPGLPEGERAGWRITGWMEQVARSQLDVALDHPIKLLANALGSPPADVIDRAHQRGVLVAALAGSARHALHHKEAGIVTHEAGGHPPLLREQPCLVAEMRRPLHGLSDGRSTNLARPYIRPGRPSSAPLVRPIIRPGPAS